MTTNLPVSIVSADELFVRPVDGNRYELVEGTLMMMSPAGGRHGRITNQIAWLLTTHVRSKSCGQVFAAETGFVIQTNPDTVLAPDVAFVHATRLATVADETRYLRLAPDLVAEVLSPNDRMADMELKALRWLQSGCRIVLVVDPANETTRVYRGPDQVVILQQDHTLDASDVVDGWSVRVSQFFNE